MDISRCISQFRRVFTVVFQELQSFVFFKKMISYKASLSRVTRLRNSHSYSLIKKLYFCTSTEYNGLVDGLEGILKSSETYI